MIILYNILFLLGFVLALPVILVKRLNSGKERYMDLCRLGMEPFIPASASRPIWVHALSVGEVLASVPLVRKMLQVDGSRPVVLSVSTVMGQEIAQKFLGKEVDAIFCFPYDLIWSVRRLIRSINPAVFVLVETDIWPNVIYEMKRRGIPFILVNGRVSPRSFAGYKYLSFFMGRVFANMASIVTQTETDAKRFVAIGALPERVHVTGNIKFDQALVSPSAEEGRSLRLSMGIAPRAKVFMAGSTHTGEEAMLLRCFGALKRDFADLVLVLVPRDPERGKRIQAMFRQAGYLALLRTELKKMEVRSKPEVIIVDTIGELRGLYGVADVVFVGKSLVDLGGQNPLEPAALKKPILFGPYMFNFERVADQLVRQGGALQVKNEKELVRQAHDLLADSKRSEAMGMGAYKVFQMNRGAVDKTLRVMERFL